MAAPYKQEKKKLDAEKGRTRWEPKTKAEETMDRKYRSWSRTRRMDEGVRIVLDDRWSVSETARTVGVSRGRLSAKVGEERERRRELKERSASAKLRWRPASRRRPKVRRPTMFRNNRNRWRTWNSRSRFSR